MLRLLPLLIACLGASACDQGRQELPKTTVRVASVAPSFETLEYRRELTGTTTLGFKSASEAFVYDADTYDFTASARSLVVGTPGQSHTWAQQLHADRSYTFVLTENAGALGHAVLEYPPIDPASPQAQVIGLHAASGMPPMDVYLLAAGGTPAAATPNATIAAHESFPAQVVTAGAFEIWLTEAGNPANVLLASNAVTFTAGTTSTIIVVPEAGHSTAALSVLFIQASSGVIYDRNVTAALRVINGAGDGQPRDLAINSQFTPPLFSATPFAAATSYVSVPVGIGQAINVTPVGNPGVLELNRTFAAGAGQQQTVFFSGPAGELSHTIVTDDRRAIPNEAKLQFFNAVTQFAPSLVEFVIVSPGTDAATAPPAAALAVSGASNVIVLPPGTFELALRRSTNSTALVSPPVTITLESGGNYSALATNGPDAETASIVLLDDFL